MPKSKNKFKLLPDEEIVIQTKHIEGKEEKIDIKILLSALGFGGLIVLTVGAFMMFINLNFNFHIIEVYIAITLIIGGSFIVSVILYLTYNLFHNRKSTFYITTKRIVQVVGKRDAQIIKKEVLLIDISHIIDWSITLEVIPKKLESNGYYEGDEEEIHPKAQNTMFHRIPKSIMIWLRGSRGKRVMEKIKKSLIENVPLKQHQNLEFLYFAEN